MSSRIEQIIEEIEEYVERAVNISRCLPPKSL